MMQRRSESVCLKPFVGLEGKGVRPMGEAGNGSACHLRKGRQTLAEVKLNGLCWEATQG